PLKFRRKRRVLPAGTGATGMGVPVWSTPVWTVAPPSLGRLSTARKGERSVRLPIEGLAGLKTPTTAIATSSWLVEKTEVRGMGVPVSSVPMCTVAPPSLARVSTARKGERRARLPRPPAVAVLVAVAVAVAVLVPVAVLVAVGVTVLVLVAVAVLVGVAVTVG